MEEKKDRGIEDETSHLNPGNGQEMKYRWGKKEREQRKREQVSNLATLDPSVASYDPQGSDGEPILVTPNPTGEELNL